MKIYPKESISNKSENTYKKFNNAERITKVIALIAAFVTVYFFFLKILFF